MLFKRIKAASISQLLLRYLAEIVIIFLGITISFLFEQWREEKKQGKELIELSKSLITDIEALKVKLKDDLQGSTNWISQLDSLRIQRTSAKFSDRQLTWFYEMVTGQIVFLFDPSSPTYISAIGSGLVNELPETIQRQLYKLYRVDLPEFQLLYNQQQDNVTNFRNTTFVTASAYLYTTEPSQITPDLTVLANEIKRPIYGNLINQIILTEKIVYEKNEDIFNSLSELENSLLEFVENSYK